MIRLTALLALSLATAASANPLQAVQDTAFGVVRGGMKAVLRLNDTQIDRILQPEAKKLEPSAHQFDLTDDNYETVLATASDNPFAQPISKDDVWVITVYGPDPISKVFVESMNTVADTNSSSAGGSLPENMRFARLSYARETVLPTKFWLWRVPVIVIATDRMQTVRFIRPGQVRPQQEDLVELLSKPEYWQQAEVWHGPFAPGEKLEPYLHSLAVYWSKFHKYSSKVPSFVILAFSGFLMNFVLSYFHKDDEKLQKEQAAKARAQAAAGSAPPAAPATPTGSTSAVKAKKGGSKRK
ncbi:hypothetical protein JCM8097_009452 [Rhodosporidiobolus ruineniae]